MWIVELMPYFVTTGRAILIYLGKEVAFCPKI